MPMPGAVYEQAFISRGERDVLMKALSNYLTTQQSNVTTAWEKHVKPFEGKETKDAKLNREIFEDHKRHHENLIAAAIALHERFRLGTYKINPTTKDGK